MNKRKITVMGGGHGAQTMAADMTLAGHTVTLFEFGKFHDNVEAIFESNTIEISGKAREGVAKIHKTTHDIAEAIKDSELLIITVPAQAHRIYAKALAKHLENGQNVVLVPGTFGSLEFLNCVKEKGCKADITVSELDTLPYATSTLS